MKIASTLLFIISLFATMSCQSGGGSLTVSGNEGGSEPVNDREAVEYQRAVNRCHRTGGTRVVKIKGELKCY